MKRFPTDLKRAIVTTLYKKGSPEDPESYGPTSITRALSKVFERRLCNQTEEYMPN